MGNPIDPVFSDRELFADFFTGYYTDFEPESAFVAIDEETGQLIGYLLGCLRYRYNAFRQKLLIATRVIPRAVIRFLSGRYDRQSRRFLFWVVFRSSGQTPKPVPRAAHFHFNLLPPYRTGRAGRKLLFTYVDHAVARGARAVYGQMQVQDDRRTRGFERYGFQLIEKRRITKFEQHFEKPIYVATLCKYLDA